MPTPRQITKGLSVYTLMVLIGVIIFVHFFIGWWKNLQVLLEKDTLRTTEAKVRAIGVPVFPIGILMGYHYNE